MSVSFTLTSFLLPPHSSSPLAGFTGKRVAAILKKTVGGKYTYAIAGRNEAKLKKIKEDLGDEDMGIIIADGGNIDTLLAMCAEAKVLLNCVGPYRVCRVGYSFVEAYILSSS